MRTIISSIGVLLIFSCSSSITNTQPEDLNNKVNESRLYSSMINAFELKFKEDYLLETFDSTAYYIQKKTIAPLPYGIGYKGNVRVNLVDHNGQIQDNSVEDPNEITYSYFYNYDKKISQDSFVKINKGNLESPNKISLGGIYKQDSILHSYLKIDFKTNNFMIDDTVYYFEFYIEKDSFFLVKIYSETEKLFE